MNHTEDVFICVILNIYDEMIPFRQMTDILFTTLVLIRLINVIYLKSKVDLKLISLGDTLKTEDITFTILLKFQPLHLTKCYKYRLTQVKCARL